VHHTELTSLNDSGRSISACGILHIVFAWTSARTCLNYSPIRASFVRPAMRAARGFEAQ
jgi:hypothetical protein